LHLMIMMAHHSRSLVNVIEDEQTEEICRKAEKLSSLNCTCGKGEGGEIYPDMISIICKGPDNYSQTLVFDKNGIVLEKTCANFASEDNPSLKELVCVEEYYFNGKPRMCDATINGERCEFCAPGGFASPKLASCVCKDFTSLRCKGYDIGNLCTKKDGSKELFLVKFEYGHLSSDSDDPPFWVVLCIFVVLVFIRFTMAKVCGSRQEAPQAYDTVEMSRQVHECSDPVE